MIEIPEAFSLASQMTDRLAGRTIEEVVVGFTTHKLAWYYGEPETFSDLAIGQVFSGARAVGGMVEGHVGNVRLLFSEGIKLRFHEPGSERPKKHQLLVGFSDGSALSAVVQMYGGVGVFSEGQCDNSYYGIAREKPSPLSDEFDRHYFQGLVTAPGGENLSMKALLATEQRIPGLGNGVLQDILFRVGVHPKTRVRAISAEQRERLLAALKKTLREMADQGGRDTELDLDGNPGRYTTIVSRKTVGTPCSICGQTIQKAAYMGGSVYFCPQCQPL